MFTNVLYIYIYFFCMQKVCFLHEKSIDFCLYMLSIIVFRKKIGIFKKRYRQVKIDKNMEVSGNHWLPTFFKISSSENFLKGYF